MREEITVLQLSYQGKAGVEIARELDISTAKVSRILSKVSKDARKDIEEQLFTTLVPLETRKRLLKLNEMDRICFEILRNSKDERVRLQCISQININDTKRFEILTSEELLSRALNNQKQALIARKLEQQQTDKQTDAHADSNTDHTSEQESEGSNDTSINESSSVSDERVSESGEPSNV